MNRPALSVYEGRTVHQRTGPFRHGFSYRLALFLIDLSRLDDAARQSRWFSANRFNLFAFHARDHGARDGGSVLDWARRRFGEKGIDLEGGTVRLLCAPRVLGFEFNPIALHFGYGPRGDLRGVIHEVHNTFGDAHAYVAAADDGPVLRHEADKQFHVSPFFDMGGRYQFALTAPDERFSLRISKQRADGSDFFATMALERHVATDSSLISLFVRQPFSTLKTIAAIHWEALRLVLKGARYHERPEPPANGTTPARPFRRGNSHGAELDQPHRGGTRLS